MTTKTEIRTETAALVQEFLKSGGKITTVATVKHKAKASVNGKQKIRHGWKAPINRPSQMWDNIPTKL